MWTLRNFDTKLIAIKLINNVLKFYFFIKILFFCEKYLRFNHCDHKTVIANDRVN